MPPRTRTRRGTPGTAPAGPLPPRQPRCSRLTLNFSVVWVRNGAKDGRSPCPGSAPAQTRHRSRAPRGTSVCGSPSAGTRPTRAGRTDTAHGHPSGCCSSPLGWSQQRGPGGDLEAKCKARRCPWARWAAGKRSWWCPWARRASWGHSRVTSPGAGDVSRPPAAGGSRKTPEAAVKPSPGQPLPVFSPQTQPGGVRERRRPAAHPKNAQAPSKSAASSSTASTSPGVAQDHSCTAPHVTIPCVALGRRAAGGAGGSRTGGKTR